MKFKTSLLAALICPMLIAYSSTALAVQSRIAGATDHTIFVDNMDNVFGFGASNYGGTPNSAVLPGSTATEFLAPVFTGITGAAWVTANTWRSAVLKKDGTIQVWGILTVSPKVVASAPMTVPASGLATDMAMTNSDLYYIQDGEVYKWSYTGTPAKVSALADGTATMVAGDREHILVLYADGTVGSYGGNSRGQLGNGSTTPKTSISKVAGISTAKGVYVTGYTSTVVLTDNSILGFGRNTDGQLGLGDMNDRSTPTLIPGFTYVTKIFGGDSYIAVQVGSSLKVAGFHNYITGGIPASTTTFVDIAAAAGLQDSGGGENTRTISLMSPGQLKGWGGGSIPVGDGTHTETHTMTIISFSMPAPVAPPVVVAQPVTPPAPIVTTPVVAPVTTPPKLNPIDEMFCKARKLIQPFMNVSVNDIDTDAYRCGDKIYEKKSFCKEVHKKDKGINVEELCKKISVKDDDDDKTKCNNGFGNGDQCAPGKSGDKNNAENSTRDDSKKKS